LSSCTIDWTRWGPRRRSNAGRGRRPRGSRCTLGWGSLSGLLRWWRRVCHRRRRLIAYRRLLSRGCGWIPVPIRIDATPLRIILLRLLLGGSVRYALALLGVVRVVRIATARIELRIVKLLHHGLLKLTPAGVKKALPEDGLQYPLTEHDPLECHGQCKCQC
jgi:hypothetical protein